MECPLMTQRDIECPDRSRILASVLAFLRPIAPISPIDSAFFVCSHPETSSHLKFTRA
jgi:hypothetical protein